MTIVPMYKRCPKCRRMYSWDPDVGNFHCPHCHNIITMTSEAVSTVKKIIDVVKKDMKK